MYIFQFIFHGLFHLILHCRSYSGPEVTLNPISEALSRGMIPTIHRGIKDYNLKSLTDGWLYMGVYTVGAIKGGYQEFRL